ncbi:MULTISPECIES: hypothetical protein [Paenibacillus]|nr:MULTISPECIES: hypothetical protein [Paenibacillus]
MNAWKSSNAMDWGCFISAAIRHIAKEAGLVYQPSVENGIVL